MKQFVYCLPFAFIAVILLIITFTLMFGCMPHQDNLEDITEEVVSKGRGVTIDIEPGQKK